MNDNTISELNYLYNLIADGKLSGKALDHLIQQRLQELHGNYPDYVEDGNTFRPVWPIGTPEHQILLHT